MRRATVTIPPELEDSLERFTTSLPAEPSLASVIQAALRQFLAHPQGTPDRLRSVLRHRRTIVEIARRHGAESIRLFGSVARGEEQPSSDIDFLVEFETDRSLFDAARLAAELEELLEGPVDVVSAANLTGEARHEVLAEAIEL